MRLLKAIQFAIVAHGEQKRKYTGEPYILHPLAVAQIVRRVSNNENALVAAVLHDVIEDTDVGVEEIIKEFGFTVANMVDWLTDKSKPEDGNRAIRKKIDRDSLAEASPIVKTIKLADLIHNSESILAYDEKFAKVYMKEKSQLLAVLRGGDEALFKEATDIVDSYYE